MKIIDLETNAGNEIIDKLRLQGWKKVKEYSCLAFDKGIDFDSYTLKNGNQKLKFEWTNWFEWEVTGSAEAIEILAKDYSLTIIN